MSWDTEQRALRLFEQVCDLPAAERAAFMERHCPNDPKLRAILESMLEAGADGGEEFAEGVGAAIVAGTLAQDRPPGVPEMFGRYRIVREIGRGGMGVVYEAEQQEPSRRVAVKVLHSGYASPDVLHRFQRGSELLGRLEHPSIAQIFEAGTNDGGVAFFAMDYVDGPSLDVFLRETTPARADVLHLFEQICDAVQHAHQKGVRRCPRPSSEHSSPVISDGSTKRSAINPVCAIVS